MASDEKIDITKATGSETPPKDCRVGDREPITYSDEEDKFEIFKKHTGGVDFRTVGWLRASIIFLKSSNIILVMLIQSMTQLTIYQ